MNFEEQLRLLKLYGLTQEAYEACLEDIFGKVLGDNDVAWKDIVKRYNIPMSDDTMRKACSQVIFGSVFVSEYFKNKNSLKDKNNIDDIKSTYRNETMINKDGTFTSDRLIEITENDLKDSGKLLKAHGFDTKEWQLVSARNNIWNVYSKKDGIKELYSSKIVVKPRTEISIQEIRDFYKELVTRYTPPIIKEYKTFNNDESGVDDGQLLLLPIMDLHLGKVSESSVVGEGKEYNNKIAKQCFDYIIDKVIQRVRNNKIEKILFPVGNDFFHYDRKDACTTAGTPQDTDMSCQTLFKDGVTMLIEGITRLSETLKTKVEVFYVPGNHDMMTSYHAIMSLWCYFYNNENVFVNTLATTRHYIEFGNTLIGFAHGDKEKKRISGLMQIEAREAWGRTLYHEWFLGHLHIEETTEENGVIIRRLPSVTGTDLWHNENGYVGSVRKCVCSLWNKDTGLDSTFNIVIK